MARNNKSNDDRNDNPHNNGPAEKEKAAAAAARKHFQSLLSTNPDNPFDPSNLYNKWLVWIQIKNQLTAGIPLNEKLIATWVRKNLGFKPTDTLDASALRMIEDMRKKLDESKRLREMAILTTEEKSEFTDVLHTISDEAAMEASGTIFLRDPVKGLYYETRCAKSALKECFSLLHIFPKYKGMKDQVQHGTFRVFSTDPVHDDRIYLDRMEPDGIEEKPIQIKGKNGTISAIKRSEFVVKPLLKFEVWSLRNPAHETYYVGEKSLQLALTLSQKNGYGSQRSQGDGEGEVVYFERLDVLGQPGEIIYQKKEMKAA